MLSVPTDFPQVGSHAFLDDGNTVEPVRILRNNGDGNVLIALTRHRFPRQIASGNRTVPIKSLRKTEQPEPAPKPVRRTKAPRK